MVLRSGRGFPSGGEKSGLESLPSRSSNRFRPQLEQRSQACRLEEAACRLEEVACRLEEVSRLGLRGCPEASSVCPRAGLPTTSTDTALVAVVAATADGWLAVDV